MIPEAIRLGPLILPIVILPIAAGLAGLRLSRAVIARSDREAARAVGETTSRALVAGFIGWKLAPLLRYGTDILADPFILLRLPGGAAGMAVAIVIAAAVAASAVVRRRVAWRPLASSALAGTVAVLMAFAVLQALRTRTDTPVGGIEATFLSGETAPLVNGDGPTVLDFWATWCGPCRAELPVKREFAEDHAGRVTLIAVNLTNTESGRSVIEAYARAHDIRYPVVLDRDGSLAARFAVRGTPTTIVLAADGTEIDRWLGPASRSRIRRAAARALEP